MFVLIFVTMTVLTALILFVVRDILTLVAVALGMLVFGIALLRISVDTSARIVSRLEFTDYA